MQDRKILQNRNNDNFFYKKKSKEIRQSNNEKIWKKEMKTSSNKKWKKVHIELCQKFGAINSKLPLAQGKGGIQF